MEQMIFYFPKFLDFKLFYKYVNTLGDEITRITLPVIDKTHIKSNHYWIMALLSKLNNLKVLKIFKSTSCACQLDFFKFL